MKVAITGSSGYVGGAIARSMRSSGYDVIELRRLRKGEGPNESVVPFQLGDRPSDERLRGCEVLVHCAYDLSAIQWRDIQRYNVEGSQLLFEGAAALGIERIILISSISAFDGCASLYGRAKLEIEGLVKGYNGIVVRPGLVYGDSPGGMMGTLGRFVDKLPVVPVIGGQQDMFLVHQEDLSKMIRKLANISDVPSLPLFACGEQSMKFRRILELLAEKRGRTPRFVPVPWRFAWLGLKTLELAGIRLGIKSDSLVSMMNPNPEPDFVLTRALGCDFRKFGRLQTS